MRVPRIFIFDIIDSNDEYILDRDQSHYLKNVLRLKTSMKVRLFNGSGYESVSYTHLTLPTKA